MYTTNYEQNHLAKYIKEFKSKTRPKHGSDLKKVKEDVLNTAMVFLKGRGMLLKAFKSGIFSRLKQSEQSSSDNKNTSLKLDNDLNTSSNMLHSSFSSGSDIPLFTPKKEQDLNINF